MEKGPLCIVSSPDSRRNNRSDIKVANSKMSRLRSTTVHCFGWSNRSVSKVSQWLARRAVRARSQTWSLESKLGGTTEPNPQVAQFRSGSDIFPRVRAFRPFYGLVSIPALALQGLRTTEQGRGRGRAGRATIASPCTSSYIFLDGLLYISSVYRRQAVKLRPRRSLLITAQFSLTTLVGPPPSPAISTESAVGTSADDACLRCCSGASGCIGEGCWLWSVHVSNYCGQ